MPKIILLGDNGQDKALFLQNHDLPAFYMEDFTILGFTVQQPETAELLLRQAGYKLHDDRCGATIEIDNYLEIPVIRDLLQEAGLQVELGNIADTLYQA